jgi:UDP-glucose 4-epimerase
MYSNVLVTGGAGYIGSHAVLALRDAGRGVVVLDDLSSGRRRVVPPEVPFIEGDVGDRALVERILREHAITAVMHFAASIIVRESVADPLKYYENNTVATTRLLQACVANGVGEFIFSSTAAVYGNADEVPIPEDAPKQPINPYGASKLMCEGMLRDVGQAHPFRYVTFRYFNVAGADPQGRSGESEPAPMHLTKVACETALGKRAEIQVYGTDFPTPDGTCLRDYIHVTDLAEAHVQALRYLEAGGSSATLNCGYGHGYSVREVLAAVEQVTGRPLPQRDGPRRPGDPPELVAAADRVREVLGWRPRYDDLGFIIRTAFEWERRLA